MLIYSFIMTGEELYKSLKRLRLKPSQFAKLTGYSPVSISRLKKRGKVNKWIPLLLAAWERDEISLRMALMEMENETE